ncbi:hypothetical protein AYI70_g12392 [Smittium culicis]|uniref:Uncharacterized protein n=1 Tax=Smittium culicis TaxID=133412 RepID=A0A1R1WXM8_9FUNG|nr:hypothetical protein AYI70_g12392 [Smittium culicis]
MALADTNDKKEEFKCKTNDAIESVYDLFNDDQNVKIEYKNFTQKNISNLEDDYYDASTRPPIHPNSSSLKKNSISNFFNNKSKQIVNLIDLSSDEDMKFQKSKNSMYQDSIRNNLSPDSQDRFIESQKLDFKKLESFQNSYIREKSPSLEVLSDSKNDNSCINSSGETEYITDLSQLSPLLGFSDVRTTPGMDDYLKQYTPNPKKNSRKKSTFVFN